MKALQLLFTVLLLQIELVNGQILTDSILIQDFRISPEHALHKRFSEVFESIQYIPLSSKKEAEFNINSSIVADSDRIFVLNYWGEKVYLLVFDSQGKFVNKVNLTVTVNNIFLDYSKKEVFINYLPLKNELMVFNYEGKFLRTEKPLYTDTYSKSTNNYLSFRQDRYKFEPTEPFDLKTYKDGKLIDKYFKVSKDSTEILYGSPNDHINMSGQEALLSIQYDYTIYSIRNDKLTKGFHFILPHHLSLPANYSSDLKYFKKKKEYLANNPLVINRVKFAYTDGSSLIFKLISERPTFYTDMIYNLNTNILVNLRQLQPDVLTNYLPIFEITDFSTNQNILCNDGHYFYSLVSASTIVEAYKSNVAQGITSDYPKELAEIIAKNKYDSNYILVKMKLKKEVL